MKLSRRTLLATLAAPLVMRPLSALASDIDVAIIGAGTAGIFAARKCLENGLSYRIFEAGNRIGGRLYTENSLGGVYDAGGAYIHFSSENPFTPLAEQLGFKTSGMMFGGGLRFTLYENGKPMTQERVTFRRSMQSKVRDVIDDYEGADKSLAAVIRQELGDKGVDAFRASSTFGLGEEPDRISHKDYNALAGGSNLSVEAGYGALLVAIAKELKISLNTSVSKIDTAQKLITLTTSQGTVSAKAVIVTPSVGVMQSGAIKMPMPLGFSRGLDGFQMGALTKIGLSTTAVLQDFEGHSFIQDNYETGRCSLEFLPNNHPLIVGVFGADEARGLIKAGENAAISHLKSRLKLIFGADIEKKFGQGKLHGWAGDALFKGSYATVKPHSFASREAIREPLADRVYYAGEASALQYSMTAGGAAIEGTRTASLLAGLLKN